MKLEDHLRTEGKQAGAQRAPLLVWWVLWFALLQGVVLLSFFIKEPKSGAGVTALPVVALLGPFLIGTAVRWLVLPRFKVRAKAFPIFIAGMALCEGTAILGIFLGGESRDVLVALGLIGIAQYVPLFAGKLE